MYRSRKFFLGTKKLCLQTALVEVVDASTVFLWVVEGVQTPTASAIYERNTALRVGQFVRGTVALFFGLGTFIVRTYRKLAEKKLIK